MNGRAAGAGPRSYCSSTPPAMTRAMITAASANPQRPVNSMER